MFSVQGLELDPSEPTCKGDMEVLAYNLSIEVGGGGIGGTLGLTSQTF